MKKCKKKKDILLFNAVVVVNISVFSGFARYKKCIRSIQLFSLYILIAQDAYNMLFTIITMIFTLFLILTEGSRASDALHLKRQAGFNGVATWFIPSLEGGPIGACGPEEADDAFIVALNLVQYGNVDSKSNFCGRSVRINHQGKSVDAVINDACPECSHGDLDLTQSVFQKLGNLETGRLAITWEFI